MDAILLVGGQGTRLRPLTVTTPKPMLPAAGEPFLTHLLARLREAGVDRVVLATSYRPEVFEEHFGDGAALGLQVSYVREAEPLGTGGAMRNVADRVTSDDVLIVNGDVLAGVDLRGLLTAHRTAGAAVTLHLTEVADPRAFGLVPTDADGRVTAFLEKPQAPEEIVTRQINAGTYVFRREVLDRIPPGRVVSVERETFPGLLADGALVIGHVDTAYWLDLGTPAAFVRGSCDLVLGRVGSPVLAGRTGESLVLPGAHVAAGARLSGGTTVGAGARVGAAEVAGSVLLDRVTVADGAVVRDSALGRDVEVGAGAVLTGVTVGDGAVIGAGVELIAGARVWPGAVLADGAVRFSSDR